MRTITRLAVIGLFGGSLGLVSCSSKDKEPAPLLEDCVGENCKLPGGSGGGGTPGTEPGGSDSTPPTGTVTVSGTILTTLDQTFATVATYVGPATVRARGEGGAQIETETAAGQFTMDDVAAGLNWFGLEEKSAQGVLISTLQPVMVHPDAPEAHLVGVDRQDFETLLYGLTPTQIANPNAGHAILFFVDADERPVPNVSLKAWAHAEAVAYDGAGGYEVLESPDEGASGQESTVLLVNINAAPYPGASVNIDFEADGELYSAPIQIASGYVTRAAIVVE